MHQNKSGSKFERPAYFDNEFGTWWKLRRMRFASGLPAVWVVLLVWKPWKLHHVSTCLMRIRSCHAPCSTVMKLQMQFGRNSTVRPISWLSCPISGDVAFLFGAVECHFELLNFACSVNGVFCTTQVAKWTHDIHVALVTLCVSVRDFPFTSIETGRMWPGDDREWFSNRKDFISLSGCQTIETWNIDFSITLCQQQDKNTLQRPAAWCAHARPPKGCKSFKGKVNTRAHHISRPFGVPDKKTNHHATCMVKLKTNYV